MSFFKKKTSTPNSLTLDNLYGNQLPKHIAIIMDGNGRWAKSKFLPRAEGHRRGVLAVKKIVEESRKLGIRYLTLYTFSTENWDRPKEEVSSLMKLFVENLEKEVPNLDANQIRLRAIGDRNRLDFSVQEALARCEEKTRTNEAMDLVLALSYGGREELVYAFKNIANKILTQELNIEEISQNTISNSLYAPDIPDPDLLIRTSNEIRVSNFLLWQIAYSEIVITPVLWPDFDEKEYQRCIQEYLGRERRFGLL